MILSNYANNVEKMRKCGRKKGEEIEED